ncbi:MAG: septal ring lytic transglycosylase RlpA family protein [Fimbriimonadaceae bacterium]|nr:septal ring lytic transglycosylase RlpA family protein [Chitinophagales bacterium]
MKRKRASILYTGIFIFSCLFSSQAYAQYKPGYTETGIASYYHDKFVGRKTATGEIFTQNKMTAAHKYLPLNCWVKVTNLSNDSVVILRINDRMPQWNKRCIDLTLIAAKKLNYTHAGLTKVKIEIIPDPTKTEVSPKFIIDKFPATEELKMRRTDLLHIKEKQLYPKFPHINYFPFPEKQSFFKKLFSK